MARKRAAGKGRIISRRGGGRKGIWVMEKEGNRTIKSHGYGMMKTGAVC